MKETYYFSHDYNAIQDPKMMAVLLNCGLSGIGMYWILIEILHQQQDNKISYQEYCDFIDFYGRLNEENEHLLNKIKQMLIDVGLFVKQDDLISSKRVLENKKQREILSEKRSIAGKKSAEIRLNQTSVEQNLTSAEQGKERKGKEKKGNNIEREHQDAPPSELAKDFFNNVDKQLEVSNYLVEHYKIDEHSAKLEIAKFVSYWTEPNKSGKKQRWEMEKVFEVKRRFATWFLKANSFQSNKTQVPNFKF